MQKGSCSFEQKPSVGGKYWTRTNDLLLVEQAFYQLN